MGESGHRVQIDFQFGMKKEFWSWMVGMAAH
jgi:hypothetical protein